jgi:hypothetical protein
MGPLVNLRLIELSGPFIVGYSHLLLYLLLRFVCVWLERKIFVIVRIKLTLKHVNYFVVTRVATFWMQNTVLADRVVLLPLCHYCFEHYPLYEVYLIHATFRNVALLPQHVSWYQTGQCATQYWYNEWSVVTRLLRATSPPVARLRLR